jgi:acyl-CoA thioester hydrolase
MNTHSIQYRVQWGDTDAAGIVFYPNYFRWFDHAGLEYLRALGLPLETLIAQHQIILPIIDAGCRFHRPARYSDLLTIETMITEKRTRTFRFEHRVTHAGEITGIGYEVRGCARSPARTDGKLELIALPEEIDSRLTDETPDVRGIQASEGPTSG